MDASTAILLAKAELLDEFIATAGIPAEVVAECGARDSLDAKLIARAISEKRIGIRDLAGLRTSRLANEFGLGPGEAAAVAMAQDEEALVATDDRKAIQACKLLRISFTTALAILVRMREKEIVTTEVALRKLEVIATAGRYRKNMIAAVREDLENFEKEG